MINETQLELDLKHMAECHLPEGMKPLREQHGEKWDCQCQASGSATREEYLEHLSQMQMVVVKRHLKGSE